MMFRLSHVKPLCIRGQYLYIKAGEMFILRSLTAHLLSDVMSDQMCEGLHVLLCCGCVCNYTDIS